MEEEGDPEDIVAMVEQPQWTGRSTTEPQMSPSLQQMFALAQRMGYEMHPIVRRPGNTRQTSNPQRMSGQNYRAPFRQGRDYSKVKCFSFPSDRTGGIRSPTAHDSALTDRNRETTYIPGTHPYRFIWTPDHLHRSHHLIFHDRFTHPPEILSSLWFRM